MRILGRASTTPETEPPDEPGAQVRGRCVEARRHPELGSALKPRWVPGRQYFRHRLPRHAFSSPST